MNSKRTFVCMLAGVVLAILVLEYTGIDFAIQDSFFNFNTKRWAVDAEAPVPRFFFYNLPKILLFFYGFGLVWTIFAPERLRRTWFPPKRTAVYLLVSLAAVPIVAGTGKTLSWVYCPSEITRYGGHAHYRRVFDRLPDGVLRNERGHCFPAAHASGGFALISLYFAGRTRKQKNNGLFIAFAVGGAMGLYQMLKGAHYLSHTVVTAIIAWGITKMLANWLKPDQSMLS